MEQSKTMNSVFGVQFFSIFTITAITIYNKNSKPCAIPIIWLGPGDSKIYFNGMVTNKISRYEIPSNILMSLKLFIILRGLKLHCAKIHHKKMILREKTLNSLCNPVQILQGENKE